MEKQQPKIEIKTITLQMGRKQIQLSIAEARQLKAALEDLLGTTKTETVYVDRYKPSPWWDWWRPYYSSSTGSTLDAAKPLSDYCNNQLAYQLMLSCAGLEG